MFATAGDGGPVEEFVGWRGGGGFLAFGGGGGRHGWGEGGALVAGWEVGGKIGEECESGCGCDDAGAGTAKGGNEDLL